MASDTPVHLLCRRRQARVRDPCAMLAINQSHPLPCRAFEELTGRGMEPNEACAAALKIAAGMGMRRQIYTGDMQGSNSPAPNGCNCKQCMIHAFELLC